MAKKKRRRTESAEEADGTEPKAGKECAMEGGGSSSSQLLSSRLNPHVEVLFHPDLSLLALLTEDDHLCICDTESGAILSRAAVTIERDVDNTTHCVHMKRFPYETIVGCVNVEVEKAPAIALITSSCRCIVLSWQVDCLLPLQQLDIDTEMSVDKRRCYRAFHAVHSQCIYALMMAETGTAVAVHRLELSIEKQAVKAKMTLLHKRFAIMPRLMQENFTVYAHSDSQRLGSIKDAQEAITKTHCMTVVRNDNDQKRFRYRLPKLDNTASMPIELQKYRHITAVCANANNESVACGDSLGRVKVWYIDWSREERNIGAPAHNMHWHNVPVTALCMSANGLTLYTGGGEAAVVEMVLHTRAQRWTRILPRLEGFCMRLQSAPTQNTLCAMMSDQSLRLIDPSSMNLRATVHAVIVQPMYTHNIRLAPSVVPAGTFENRITEESMLLVAGRPGHVQCVRVHEDGVMTTFRDSIMLDLAQANFPLVEMESGVIPYVDLALLAITYPTTESDDWGVWLASVHCLYDDATGDVWDDIVNEQILTIWHVHDEQRDANRAQKRQGKLQLYTRYAVPMSERITDLQFVRIEPHRTEDEKGVLQLVYCCGKRVVINTCTMNYVSSDRKKSAVKKEDEQVPEDRRKQTYEWQMTQTLSRGSARAVQVTSASTEQQHLLMVRYDTEVSMYKLEGCVETQRMLNGVQQWRMSGKRFPGLGIAGAARRILIDAHSSMCFMLSTKGKVQAETIDESGRFQKAWYSDVYASALSDAVIRHNGESFVAVAELEMRRLLAQLVTLLNASDGSILWRRRVFESKFDSIGCLACDRRYGVENATLFAITRKQYAYAVRCFVEEGISTSEKRFATNVEETKPTPFTALVAKHQEAKRRRQELAMGREIGEEKERIAPIDKGAFEQRVKTFVNASSGALPSLDKLLPQFLSSCVAVDQK